MPRCPAGAMDEGPVDLRTRPKAAGLPGAALPLRKRPLRAPSPEPAAPRCAAGPLAAQEHPLLGGSSAPAAPASRHGLARPEALYYQGECLSPVKVGLGARQGTGSPEAGHTAQRGQGEKPRSETTDLGRWGAGPGPWDTDKETSGSSALDREIWGSQEAGCRGPAGWSLGSERDRYGDPRDMPSRTDLGSWGITGQGLKSREHRITNTYDPRYLPPGC